MENKIKIGITHGDINGVGYEIILKMLQDPALIDLCTPIVYGSPKVAAYHKKVLNIESVSFNIITKVEDANHKRINIINCVDEEVKVELGKSTPIAGRASWLALERATKDCKRGAIDALVTAPINKKNIQSENFQFTGHTDYLRAKFDVEQKVLMIMATESLKVGLLTMHIPLAEVPSHVTSANLREHIQLFENCLKQDFRILKPRIAVLGVNPHAGDSGVIGKEEQEVIKPVISELKNKGLLCYGPFAADGFFGSESYRSYDGVLAMYHDQGLVPFKTLAMEYGVNYSAGLPIIRTSPDHGTAYDIVGMNKASEMSIRHALYMAIDIFNNRHFYEEAHANPLRRQYYEKGADMDASAIEDTEI
ncbi:MAG: 4-hydroxythreonine-4-phosphate dehydrogenase PdxA [Bacteroidales bacterium]|jgi:4-hydroxythreonine-4-phosphate dehydrogenase|nr:4-hydroxythreonine-4-phosphate dehydrogenase PdxA [Bacteroidales bacterium]